MPGPEIPATKCAHTPLRSAKSYWLWKKRTAWQNTAANPFLERISPHGGEKKERQNVGPFALALTIDNRARKKEHRIELELADIILGSALDLKWVGKTKNKK